CLPYELRADSTGHSFTQTSMLPDTPRAAGGSGSGGDGAGGLGGRRGLCGIAGSPLVECQRKSGLYLTVIASPLCNSLTTMSLFGCLRLRRSAASMANALRSRYVRGVPSIEISNCAPGAFASGRNFVAPFIATSLPPILLGLATLPIAPGCPDRARK